MAELSEFTLYHRAVRDVGGNMLLSLNDLHALYPEVYAREVQKDAGREVLLTEPMLPLCCRWSDVLFFSPVHPQVLLDAVRLGGCNIPPLRFRVVNAARLEPARACIRFVKPWKNGAYVPPQLEEYAPLTAEVLEQVSTASVETLERLAHLPPDAPLLLWSEVPHVLYRGGLSSLDLQEFRA